MLKRILKWTTRIFLIVLILALVWGFISYWRSNNNCEQITAQPAHPMKAILQCDYGVTNLTFQNVEKPVPADNQILVKVRSASVNSYDGHVLRGTWIIRPMTGMRKPKDIRVGGDVSGQVEAVGKNITRFKSGDEVFGSARGSLAEYACGSERSLVIKPNKVPFEQAGAVANAGLTALQGLRVGNVHAGQKVLINGASGGVGTFAVQIAKAFGAEVTGVCSTRNLDLVKSIGADHIIDYTKEDFTKGNQPYDMIFDIIGNHSFSERRRVLTPDGSCVLVGIGGAGQRKETWGRLGGNFTSAFLSRFVKQKFLSYITKLSSDDMTFLGELMQSGKLKTVIDRTYPLDQAAGALRYLEEGHARGKVVIKVASDLR